MFKLYASFEFRHRECNLPPCRSFSGVCSLAVYATLLSFVVAKANDGETKSIFLLSAILSIETRERVSTSGRSTVAHGSQCSVARRTYQVTWFQLLVFGGSGSLMHL